MCLLKIVEVEKIILKEVDFVILSNVATLQEHEIQKNTLSTIFKAWEKIFEWLVREI